MRNQAAKQLMMRSRSAVFCRKYLEQPDHPAVPCTDHALIDIRDGQAALQVLICGREALRRAGLRAEDDLFYVHI